MNFSHLFICSRVKLSLCCKRVRARRHVGEIPSTSEVCKWIFSFLLLMSETDWQMSWNSASKPNTYGENFGVVLIFVVIEVLTLRKARRRSCFLAFSGESGVPIGVKMGSGVGEPKANHPRPHRDPHWDPHNPHKMEKIRSHSWFEKIRTMLTQIFL